MDFFGDPIQEQVKLIKFWAREAIQEYHAENPAVAAVGEEDP